MKNIKLFLFLCFVINYSFIFSQENISKIIVNPFQKEALLREKVFIHINKTIYFTNENIWFTAYVSEDSKNKPSNYTTNLHVNLLNTKGDIIDSKKIFIKNGTGYGNFLINEKHPSGKFYIQGFTNFMNNFGKENVFIQEIDIINPAIKSEITQNKSTNNYDVQLFPESGYLLEDTQNIVGIKALINDKGYPFTGRIENSKGIEITTFKGNFLGMSKCEFFYSKNETYTAVININNTTQKISLPKANSTGIIFSINNKNTDKIKLTLKTNKETLPTLNDESLAILVYRNNYISEAVTLSLKNNQQITQELYFDKSKMLHGVNIITLFKNNQPIAERKFFIERSNQQTAILIEKLKTVNDSINFKIQTINSKNKAVDSQLSISVLPKDSKAFSEKQNIKSAFLLSPYIKGNIENITFYFKNTNPKEKEFLDLLLLNQGWSAYTLEEKIKEINPTEQFLFEQGFTLHGNVKKNMKGYDISIISNKNRVTAFTKFNKNNDFSFENIYAYKNDSIRMALIKKDQPLMKPKEVVFIVPKPENLNFSYLTNQFNYKNIIENKPISNLKNYTDLNEIRYVDPIAEQLDEVVLKTLAKREETIYEKEMNLAYKRNVLAPSFYQNKKVTEQMEQNYHTIFEYFWSLGFIKTADDGSFFITLRNAPATLTALLKNPDGTFPPTIFIDNLAIKREGNIEMLRQINTTDIDEILINRLGAGGGLQGAGGIIKIYLKKGGHQYFEEESQKLYKELILLTGFDKAKTYFKPQYNLNSKASFNWTEIDWKYSVQTNEKGETFIKVPVNEFSNEFQFIINGFSNNGLLFYDIYTTGNDDF